MSCSFLKVAIYPAGRAQTSEGILRPTPTATTCSTGEGLSSLVTSGNVRMWANPPDVGTPSFCADGNDSSSARALFFCLIWCARGCVVYAKCMHVMIDLGSYTFFGERLALMRAQMTEVTTRVAAASWPTQCTMSEIHAVDSANSDAPLISAPPSRTDLYTPVQANVSYQIWDGHNTWNPTQNSTTHCYES